MDVAFREDDLGVGIDEQILILVNGDSVTPFVLGPRHLRFGLIHC